jgi:hypothetical protein
MKKLLITGMVFASMFAMQLLQAATICDVKVALSDARSNLVTMVGSTDKAEQEALKVKIDEATTRLEEAYGAMLNDDNADDDVQLNTFKETWAAFKNTRETEIVPAIYAGKNADAKAIATGIQAERMKVMNDVVQALGGDDCKAEK